MAINRNPDVSVFVNDQTIGFFEYNSKKRLDSLYGILALESGVVKNGYVLDPKTLASSIKTLFKKNNLRPKSIRLAIHDQNILVREIKIPNLAIAKVSLDDYVSEQKEKSFHFPFEKTLIDYKIHEQTDETTTILLLAADENLFHDYFDIFESVGVKNVVFDLVSSSIYQTYISTSNELPTQTMLVSLYDNMVSLQIIERSSPIFSLVEVFEETGTLGYFEFVLNYIERIANYYKYNIRKGGASIINVVVVNLAERITSDSVREKLVASITDFKARLFEFFMPQSAFAGMPKVAQVAFASSLSEKSTDKFRANFKLVRKSEIESFSHFVLMTAVAIFSLVTLVYIPYINLRDDVNNQITAVNILQNQYEILLEEIAGMDTWTNLEKDYGDAFIFLQDQNFVVGNYYEDLQSQLGTDVFINSFLINEEDKTITLMITGNVEQDLYEYLLRIYEDYGIIEGVNDPLRWMDGIPGTKSISSNVMEVTVIYA
jgi:hypothetical protein